MASRKPIKLILVGVDFSEPSRMALQRAFELAGALRARVEVLHVVPKMHPLLPSSQANRAAVTRIRRETRAEANKALRRLLSQFPDVSAQARIREGLPHHEILKRARELRADLIVVANRGHSPLESLLIGSTAERVLRKTVRPVLLVPAPRRAGQG